MTRIWIEADEWWPVYTIKEEPDPENDLGRRLGQEFEADVPDDLIERYRTTQERFVAALNELIVILGSDGY